MIRVREKSKGVQHHSLGTLKKESRVYRSWLQCVFPVDMKNRVECSERGKEGSFSANKNKNQL